MKKAIVFLLAAGCNCSVAQENIKNDENRMELVVHANKKIHPVGPDFWGTNLLYWIDDDAALADGKIAAGLKEAHIKLLRYPGGTVADNFHWRSNTLENVHMFPYESGAPETDFDEFMLLCRETGAEPSCVLNTESWAVKNDIAGGAHEAANWLRYCKRKGYQVKYWEIGNETYWHPVMTAEEYAALVNVYADSLKRIDPHIILGVNGHWDLDFVGTKERLKKETLPQLMNYRRNIASREDYSTYKQFLKTNTTKPVTRGDTKWWRTVAERCGNKIDMIIVHWYFNPGQLDLMSHKLSEVKALFAEMYPEKSFLFNMSEYNTTQPYEFNKDEYMYLTEAIGAMLNAGMDIASFWPLRMKNYGKSTLVNHSSNMPSIVFKIHQQLSQQLKGSLIQVTRPDEVPAFASYAGTSCTLVMTGRLNDKTKQIPVKVQGNRIQFSTCSVWRIKGNAFDYEIGEETVPVNNKGIAMVNLEPKEVVIATFK